MKLDVSTVGKKNDKNQNTMSEAWIFRGTLIMEKVNIA